MSYCLPQVTKWATIYAFQNEGANGHDPLMLDYLMGERSLRDIRGWMDLGAFTISTCIPSPAHFYVQIRQLNRAFVQYSFSSKPHPILQKPHGNSKFSKPFVRTTPSTLQKLKECRRANQLPKQAVSAVTKEKGGIVNARTIGDIPRNRRQVYNIKRNQGEDGDALLSVMAMCKQSMDKDEEPFVRIVTSAPEPMCVQITS